MSVGGTSIFSKLPLMESLPPIAPNPNRSCAVSAPNSAAVGLPHRAGSAFMRSKNSCNVKRILPTGAPAHTALVTLKSTEYTAPKKGDSLIR